MIELVKKVLKGREREEKLKDKKTCAENVLKMCFTDIMSKSRRMTDRIQRNSDHTNHLHTFPGC